MSAYVFFFAASCVLAGVACLVLGGFVLYRSRKPLNISYFLLTAALFEIGVTQMFLQAAGSPEAAHFWKSLQIFGWLVFFPLFTHFGLVAYGARVKNPFLYSLFFVPSAAMYALWVLTPLYVLGYKKGLFGYDYVPGPWNFSYVILFTAYVLTAFFLFYRVSGGAREFYRRKQARIILIASVFPLLVGTSYQLFLMLGIPTLELSLHAIATIIVFIGYAILRFQPTMGLTKEKIAEAAAVTLNEPMFLTDSSKKINYANPAACLATGWRADQLLGKNLDQVMPGTGGGLSQILHRDGTATNVKPEAYRIGMEKGFLVLAQDLSSLIHLRESIERLNSELNERIDREQKAMEWYFRFFDQSSQKGVEETWEEMLTEAPELESDLKTLCELMRETVRVVDEAKDGAEGIRAKEKESSELAATLKELDEELSRLQKEHERLTA